MTGIKEDYFNLDFLMKIVPQKVKIELLKDEMTKVYNKELKLKQLLSMNNIDSDLNSLSIYKEEHNKIYDMLGELRECNIDLFKFINSLKLSEESLEKIYLWAKMKRHELGLSSNLYNVYEHFIPDHILYQEANDKLDKYQKSL